MPPLSSASSETIDRSTGDLVPAAPSNARTRQAEESFRHPPTEAPVLQVGLIGHRALDAEALGALRERGRQVLAEIRAAAHAAVDPRSKARLRLRCVCALAEGADLILAEEALAQGYALAAPLPFERGEYRKDFAEEAVGSMHDRILARAETVFELDGNRARAEAYSAVGRLLIEQSDLLVAIWDGQPELGPGGTGDVLHEAWLADVPTIIIGSAAPHDVRIHDPVGGESTGGISAAIDRILSYRPPAAGPDGLAVYHKEELRRDGAVARLPSILTSMLRLNRSTKPPTPVVDGASSGVSARPTAAVQIDAVLQPHFDAADRLAVHYGTLYRVSGMLRYLCALPSTLGAVMAFYGPAWMARPGFLIQLVSLGGVLVIYAIDRSAQWHRRFLDYRFIAEHLRSSKIMALLGSTAALPRRPADLASGSDWVAHHLRLVVRSLGLVNARIDTGYLGAMHGTVTAEIRSQAGFYAMRSRRYQTLSAALQKIGLGFYGVGLLCTILRYAMAVGSYEGPSYDLMAELALVLPSVAPIFLGLRSQAEYNRLSQRYASTSARLRRIQHAFTPDDTRRSRVERMARETVHVLLGEVSDWRVLIKARDLSPF